MLFSVNYHSKFLEKADEIKCPFNQLGQIYNFIKEHPEKRYVIADASSQEHNRMLEQIDTVRSIVRDYTIECGSMTSLKSLIKQGYKAYLRFPVSDWEMFYDFLDLGISDIYIDGALGFQIKQVAQICKEHKVLVRVSPTVSPAAAIKGLKPYSFFIRPEDLKLYEKYIDIIDFKITQQEKEDATFSIYKRGNFIYNLQDLLDQTTFSVPNPYIKPEFGQARLNCGQHCLLPGRSCHLCETQISLTNLVHTYFSQVEKEKQEEK